jgi:acyl-coenzyme A thioesterase PaaI-like protein
MSRYTTEEITAAELARITAVAEALAGDVRDLVDATVRTEVDEETVAAAREHLAAATALLRRAQLDGAFGVRFSETAGKRNWGNAVCGLRNPVAPPLTMSFDGERLTGSAHLGAAYEGPAGLVHGGIVAALLDQALGSAVEHSGAPGMTGTLTLRYRQGTVLGPVTVSAWLDRVEGVKSFAKGTLSTADGVTVEAEGVFILPRWARGEVREAMVRAVGEG